MLLKISIITVCKNNVSTIAATIQAIVGQNIKLIEHIIIDGRSTDGTLDIIKKSKVKYISESDSGIYDAMNKGVWLATGDIIGILNADDVYAHKDVLKKVIEVFEQNPSVDVVYGDLFYVKQDDLNKIVRYWRAGEYQPGMFLSGWMPPHPAFFVRKSAYEQYGTFDLRLPLAADYELMLRFLGRYRLKTQYLPEVLVKMRLGGASNKSLKNLLRNYQENKLAWKFNGLKPHWYTIIAKRLQKIPQYWYTLTSRGQNKWA